MRKLFDGYTFELRRYGISYRRKRRLNIFCFSINHAATFHNAYYEFDTYRNGRYSRRAQVTKNTLLVLPEKIVIKRFSTK